ncbi:MAG: hypothetical protein ACOCZR_01310 [Halanaerobiales bacterium]
MFNDLTDFSKQRTIKEAIGFYLYYLCFGLLLSLFLGGIGYFLFYFENPWLSFIFPAQVISTIYSLTIYFTVYFKKNFHSFSFLILGVFVGVLNVLFTILISLLFSAFLSTRQPAYEKNIPKDISFKLKENLTDMGEQEIVDDEVMESGEQEEGNVGQEQQPRQEQV